MKTFIFYHQKCFDGMASLWILQQRFPEAEVRAIWASGECPDEVAGATVILADVCFNEVGLRKALLLAEKVIILDHHQTTLDVLTRVTAAEVLSPKLELYIDSKLAGCQIAWKYVNGSLEGMSPILQCIAENDIWAHSTPFCKEIMCVIYRMEEKEFFEALAEREVEHLILTGVGMKERFDAKVQEAYDQAYPAKVSVTLEDGILHEYRVWVTVPRDCRVVSEVGHQLSLRPIPDVDGEEVTPDFAVVYNRISRRALMRAVKEEIELGRIAEKLGVTGGGHHLAAACTMAVGTKMSEVFVPLKELPKKRPGDGKPSKGKKSKAKKEPRTEPLVPVEIKTPLIPSVAVWNANWQRKGKPAIPGAATTVASEELSVVAAAVVVAAEEAAPVPAVAEEVVAPVTP
jgi:hypothetical protein